ncbi:unnamed protein product [Thlaspi arvense]|uniref:Uncharacterized protein n=1 Tax=Thlaspi arvense TaxID=13288 RepID=A0AAU9REK7_THLAR|nr:unnamed protein product [Thlaspi arvense]
MVLTATFLMAVVFLASPIIIHAADSSDVKLDEGSTKCSPACIQYPPPPPPSFPPPPPPSTPSPPTPSYCPPPPPYVSPPGDIYPVDHDFGLGAAAAGESFTTVKLIVLGVIGFMFLGI